MESFVSSTRLFEYFFSSRNNVFLAVITKKKNLSILFYQPWCIDPITQFKLGHIFIIFAIAIPIKLYSDRAKHPRHVIRDHSPSSSYC